MTITTASAQRYARLACILILISLVAGAYGEFYISSQNLTSGSSSFRLGFAAYHVEAACDIALALWLAIFGINAPAREARSAARP
jgi:hypothetical protein